MTDDPGRPPASEDDDARPPISTTLGADVAPASARAIGTVVAEKYVVERILGRGGMGVVLGARHIALGELVAIKFLSAGASSDATATERFLREARAALKIKGEHVVRVLDVGAEGGVPYLVMEHLDGTDLGTLLVDRGPLAIADLTLYVLQACEALAEAHGQGIVHRDIKPSNLFLTQRPDGSPLIKVLDFGIAKAEVTDTSRAAPSLTDTHAVFGSPAYMSPEQIRSAKKVDARTDIWALGVVMYELLAGEHPFRGETTGAVLASVSADTPASVRSLRADVPRELGALIERCLEKDPEKRVQTVLDLAIGLAPFAPQGQVSTDRIRRLSARVPAARKEPRPSAPPSATHAPWETAPLQPAPKRRLLLGFVVVLFAAGAGALAAIASSGDKFSKSRGGTPASATLASPLTPAFASATGARAPAAPPAAAPAPEANPPTSQSPSADASAPTIVRPPRRSGIESKRAPEPPAAPSFAPTPPEAAPPSIAPSTPPPPTMPRPIPIEERRL